MLTVSVNPKIFDRFPSFRRGIVVAINTNNCGRDPELEARLAETVKAATDRPIDLGTDPRVVIWSDAHRRFGSNPNRFPPSHLALLKRVQTSGASLPFVNKAVAIMSCASITGVIPIGADDVVKAGYTLELCEASGKEVFAPLGQPDSPEHPVPGEVVYVAKDSGVVMCRRWNWRNSHLSALSEETRDIVFNIDGLGEGAEERTIAVRDLVASLLARHCGARVIVGLLHPERTTFRPCDLMPPAWE
jgi:DNA/RNA-binding domain of Phe-tRNA-synthetase-like protein